VPTVSFRHRAVSTEFARPLAQCWLHTLIAMSEKRSADGTIVAVVQSAKRSKTELALTPAEQNKALVAKVGRPSPALSPCY